jgi:membrane associated rhomboid family serine protease
MILLWPPVSQEEPGLLGWLWLSADRPWGIVTSNFANYSPEGPSYTHLTGNLESFTLVAVFFVVVCLELKIQDRRRWSRVFFWLLFLSGIIGSAIEYPLLVSSGDFSWGASGMVYGALGVLLAACIRSFPVQMRALSKEHRRWARRRKKWKLFRFDRKSLHTLPNLLSLAILMAFIVLILTDPAGFLSVAPGVDVTAHGLGFLLGFLPAMVLLKPTIRPTRKRTHS